MKTIIFDTHITFSELFTNIIDSAIVYVPYIIRKFFLISFF